jgi:beta-lactamase superfamily II metal-dependent hydrolase
MPYAAYPTVFVRETPNGKKKQQLLWGDWVQRLAGEDDDWVEVRGRGEQGWLRRSELQEEQLLEVCWVDVGQGDGCLMVAPKDEAHERDRFLLIDAGEKDNMARFLAWRFNLRRHPERTITFDTAVLSHPDEDHYKGFEPLFENPQLRFRQVFHNGIVERVGNPTTGRVEEIEGRRYLVELCPTQADVDAVVRNPTLAGGKQYPRLLATALGSGRVDALSMISSRDGHLPGFGPQERLSIRVLGPVPETLPDGRSALRWFDRNFEQTGKTKNGHSVVLLATYGNVRLLLGGDLNTAAEHYLLAHYTGLDPDPASPAARAELVAAARRTFACDVAKACHHGSADFSTVFLEALNPVATVISSGDEEPHCHPRPDTLGALGKASRGERPLIFSTELARSTRDQIPDPAALHRELEGLAAELAAATTDAERTRLQERIRARITKLERSVAVFGMITLRTDGTKALLAQKLEEPRALTREEFDVHRLEPDTDGVLRYVSRH